MPRGKVDFFNDVGKYGFIVTDAVEEDVFFHMEDLEGPDLKEGQEVKFTIEQKPKGPRVKDLVRDHNSSTSDDLTGTVRKLSSSGTKNSTDSGNNGYEQDNVTEIYDGDIGSGTEFYDEDDGPSFCHHCGTEVTAYSDPQFCPNCGSSL